MMPKVILLTGASGGIGFALAKKLYAANYLLSMGVRNPSELEDTV